MAIAEGQGITQLVTARSEVKRVINKVRKVNLKKDTAELENGRASGKGSIR